MIGRCDLIDKRKFRAVSLKIFPDTRLDSGKQPELGVTMEDGWMEVRDSQTGDKLQTLDTL